MRCEVANFGRRSQMHTGEAVIEIPAKLVVMASCCIVKCYQVCCKVDGRGKKGIFFIRLHKVTRPKISKSELA
jgi:hypothetical protein